MRRSISRKFRRAAPLAAAAAVAVGGAALVELGPPPVTTALAQSEPATAGLRAPSFADVVERASEAVVNISVTTMTRPTSLPRVLPPGLPEGPLEEFFGRFFDTPNAPSIPREGAGSGFIIDPEGYVVTNHHVIAEADEILVTLQDGRQLEAQVVGEDPQMDLALLELDAGGALPYVEFADSDQMRVGDWVITIGNPFGLGGSATAGIISARGRDIRSGPYDDYLQIDAPINRGNSGGPVFNADGEVIGVSTAIFSPNGGNVGIGFAIPSNQAAAVVAQLKETGTVARGWLGVQLQQLDGGLAQAFGAESAEGALVAEVLEGSPAASAGLAEGDVVTRFAGEPVTSIRDLTFAVAEHRPGERVTVGVLRGGDELDFEVVLGDRAESQPVASRGGARRAPERSAGAELGLQLAPLTDRERSALGLAPNVDGVLVADVEARSPAAEAGVRRGDVIVSVNRRDVRSPNEAVAAIRQARRDGGPALLLVRRSDGQQFIALG